MGCGGGNGGRGGSDTGVWGCLHGARKGVLVPMALTAKPAQGTFPSLARLKQLLQDRAGIAARKPGVEASYVACRGLLRSALVVRPSLKLAHCWWLWFRRCAGCCQTLAALQRRPSTATQHPSPRLQRAIRTWRLAGDQPRDTLVHGAVLVQVLAGHSRRGCRRVFERRRRRQALPAPRGRPVPP